MRNVPVILFAYARPDHLLQTLVGLRSNQIPLLYAFSDGPATPEKIPAVDEVRQLLRSVDWCEIVICDRQSNLGLGRSILTGVTEVLKQHEAVIVFEDDLVCVPGTYPYLCAALDHYWDDPRVMSVTGWTHPSVAPHDIGDKPYFDGRGESWSWGTWGRAWHGVEETARTLMRRCARKGIDVYRYGADLPEMASVELRRNLWAVRFIYWHILNQGLCLRPPWSMVEHIGFDSLGTNAKIAGPWANPPLRPCPGIPSRWPEPVEQPDCAALWQYAYGGRPTLRQRLSRFVHRSANYTKSRIRKIIG